MVTVRAVPVVLSTVNLMMRARVPLGHVYRSVPGVVASCTEAAGNVTGKAPMRNSSGNGRHLAVHNRYRSHGGWAEVYSVFRKQRFYFVVHGVFGGHFRRSVPTCAVHFIEHLHKAGGGIVTKPAFQSCPAARQCAMRGGGSAQKQQNGIDNLDPSSAVRGPIPVI